MSERERPSTAIICAVIGAIAVIVAALIQGWSSQKSESPPTRSENPPKTAVNLPKYQHFVALRDDTGSLTIDIPQEWGDQRTNGWHPGNITGYDGRVGPGMNAAPNIYDWFNDIRSSGVFVGASSLLSREFDPARLLDVMAPARCSLADERSYAARGLSGQQQIWDCGSYRWFHLAARPDDRSYLVYAEIRLVDPRDEVARDQILASLQVTGKPA